MPTIYKAKLLLKLKLEFKPRFYTWNRNKGNKLYGLYLNGFEQVTLFHKKVGFIEEKANKLEHFLVNIAPLGPCSPVESCARGI